MQKINTINSNLLKSIFDASKEQRAELAKNTKTIKAKETSILTENTKGVTSRKTRSSKTTAKNLEIHNPINQKKRNELPTAISSILHGVLAKKGLDKKIGQYSFIQHWEEIVGTDLAKKTKPAKIKGDCLFVYAINSVWAQELSFHKLIILEKLQKFLAEGQILRNVEFRVGEV